MNRVDAEIPSDGYGISLIALAVLAVSLLLILDIPFTTGGW